MEELAEEIKYKKKQVSEYAVSTGKTEIQLLVERDEVLKELKEELKLLMKKEEQIREKELLLLRRQPEDETFTPPSLKRIRDQLDEISSHRVAVPSFWLVEGSIINALSVKGVRCHIYRYADKYLGYYHDSHPAIYYDDNILMIHVIFKTEEKALLFESHNLQIAATTSPLKSPANCGSRIYFKDYTPNESESPQDSISQITPVFSTFDSTTDEFKFQRIENIKVFGSGGGKLKVVT